MQCSHAHDGSAADAEIARKLGFATALTAVIVGAEIVGGLWSRSLALLSDAAHAFSDVFALGLACLAFRLAQRPPSAQRTYGWHRAEVLAALTNGLSLLLIVAAIFREAWHRFYNPPDVRAGEMLAIAIIGLAVNAIVLVRLGGHGHEDLNLRGAYLHVLGDLLGSVAVVAGGVAIAVTGISQIDPIVSALIACIVLSSGLRLLYDVVHILLQGVPRGMRLEEVVAAIKTVPGVEDVHDLHAWSVCSHVRVLSAHVATSCATEEERSQIVTEVNRLLHQRFGVAEITLQVESGPCEVSDLLHAAGHGEAAHD